MSNKKTVRLTESEMVSLIENIVNQVKSEKRRKINESKSKKKTLLRERHHRLLMEATEAEIIADIDELGEDPPENERESLLDKVESLVQNGKLKLEDFKDDVLERLKGLFGKSKKRQAKLKRYFGDMGPSKYSRYKHSRNKSRHGGKKRAKQWQRSMRG